MRPCHALTALFNGQTEHCAHMLVSLRRPAWEFEQRAHQCPLLGPAPGDTAGYRRRGISDDQFEI